MELSGWGRWPAQACRLEHLRRGEDAPSVVAENATLIARGNGRAYGDAALNPALTLSMLAMDRLQAFDEQTGLLTCEAGVLLADILRTFVPRGWLPRAVPEGRHVVHPRIAGTGVQANDALRPRRSFGLRPSTLIRHRELVASPRRPAALPSAPSPSWNQRRTSR